MGEGGGAGGDAGQGEGGASCVWKSFGFLQLGLPATDTHIHLCL